VSRLFSFRLLITAGAVTGLGLVVSQASHGTTVLASGVNLVCFVAFGLDKVAAPFGAVRIPEKVLHVLSLAGAVGACLGRYLFRHKSLHTSFTVSSACGVALLWSIALSMPHALR
jgi:uncharacterized membrane protein YsdA (DUF1294 family)